MKNLEDAKIILNSKKDLMGEKQFIESNKQLVGMALAVRLA